MERPAREFNLRQAHPALRVARGILAELAREYGFRDVVVIDEDLGRSAGGAVDRPHFRNLVGQICEGVIGAAYEAEVAPTHGAVTCDRGAPGYRDPREGGSNGLR